MRKIQALKYLITGCSMAALMAGEALAQETVPNDDITEADDSRVLGEVVVTARQREESLQDTPVTVSAFTDTDLERQGVSSIAGYADLVPNLFLVETQNATFSFPNIRGISQSRNIDPSVAVVIDGVLSTSPIALSQELFDVQQVEVYKGPQGALYGRNAIGGAINIQTKKPSNEFEGLIRGSYGNGRSGRAQAVLSGPLIRDQLYARGSFSFRDSEGVRDNVFLGIPSDPSRNFSGRVRLLWEPADNFTADLRGSFSDDQNSAITFIDIAPFFVESTPGSGLSLGQVLGLPPFSPFAPFGNAGFTAVNEGVDLDATDLLVDGNFILNVGDADNIDDFSVQTNLNGIDRRDIYNVSLKLDYETEYFTITSVSSYDRAENFTRGEQPPRTSTNTQINSQFRSTESFSQEIRLTSPGNQRLRWIAGGYLQVTDQFLSTTVQRDFFGTDGLIEAVFRDPLTESSVCQGSPFPTAANGGLFDNQGNCILVGGFNADEQDQTAFAFFGQINFDLTDTLELSFSARYDQDNRTNTLLIPDELLSPTVLNAAGIPAGFGAGFETDAQFDSFQPLATIRWTPTPNINAYATYSEGFRSGGFNPGGFSELIAQLNADAAAADPTAPLPFVEGIQPVFPQQDTRGGEVGLKTNFFNNRLIVNLAAFYTDVTNTQTFTFPITPTIGQQVVIPIDDVEIYGFEFDGAVRPTDWLEITAGFAINESEVLADTNRGPGIVGNEAPLTPDTTLNLGAEISKTYEFRGALVDAFLSIDYQRIGNVFFLAENFAERDPLNRIGLVGGFDINEDLSIIGRVDNLTNENFCGELFNPGGFCFPGPLRTWAIEVTKRF